MEACESLRGLRERCPISFHLGRPGRAGGPGTFKKATSGKPQLRDLGEMQEVRGPGREKPKRQGPHRKDVGRKEEHGGRPGVRVPRRGPEPEVEHVTWIHRPPTHLLDNRLTSDQRWWGWGWCWTLEQLPGRSWGHGSGGVGQGSDEGL